MRLSHRAFLALLWVLLPLPAGAQRLPTVVVPEHYELAFTLDLPRERFEGVETIRVRVSEPTRRIVLHSVGLEFREVTVGAGARSQTAVVTADADAQTATFTVPAPIPAGSTEVRVRYTGVLNQQLRGFYLSQGKNRKYAVTQFEATDARRAFPCFDEPAFKATFAVTLTVDQGDEAISNGKVISDTPGPAAGQHTITFATTAKMSSYLVAMAVGDFQCLEGAADGIPIRICATPDKKALGQIALESAQQVLTFYNRYYAIRYPFEKLDVLAVPDFAAGAMENTGAIFYRETDLLADSASASVDTRKNIASILAHEMAHQWFGDLVTMQWWDDIWLNEGFATWMANKPLAADHPDWHIAVDEAGENQDALALDSLITTRPIHAEANTPAQIDEAFDVIAYQKGAAVLRMVEQYVGAETFRTGVNAYLQAHAYGNATSEDFWKSISNASGKPVDRILPTFLNQPGMPLVEVALACSDGQTTVTLTQRRFVLDPAVTAAGRERWQIPVCVKAPGQSAAVCEVITDSSRAMTIPGGCAPWVFANAGAQGYYRTAYPPSMLRALGPQAEATLSAPERLTLLSDEWALVRAGRHSASDYLELASGFGHEHTSGVLQDLRGRFDVVHEYLTTDATRPAFEAFVRTLLKPLFDEVGFSAGSGADTDERRALRAVVVGALGTVGQDPDIIAGARAALDRALGGGPALEPAMAGTITALAASHGDAALFDALVAAAGRAESPDEQYRNLYALGRFTDPALIDRGLDRVLSQVRSQDAAQYLGRFFANPAARRRAWTFLTGHWPALEPKLTVFGSDTNLVRSLSGFCDAASRDEIVSFFGAHPLPAAARMLTQTVERINGCIGLREKQTAAVTDWLASRR